MRLQGLAVAAFLAVCLGIRAEETAPPENAGVRAVPVKKPPKKTFDGRKLLDKSVTASAINSEQASSGMVLTADGTGLATWAGGTGTLTTNIIGNVTGNVSGSAASFTGPLAGEVTGTQGATVLVDSAVVSKKIAGFVSGPGAVGVGDSLLTAINKLNGNDALKAPLASPTFTGTITGNLTGNVTGNVSGTAANIAGAGIVGIVNGGTGSATKNFLDLTTNQTVTGNKTFNGNTLLGVSENTAVGFDSQTNARMGFIKKNANNPMLASGSGIPLQFGQVTNQADIFTNIAGATLLERMRIDGGNVGINAQTLDSTLTIRSTGANNSLQDASLSLATAFGGNLWQLRSCSAFQSPLNGPGGALQFYNASQGFISMTILDTGLVGIGTTNPTKGKVEIGGTGTYDGANGVHGIGDFSSYRSGTIGSITASLYCSSNVVANSFIAFSDARIKRVEGQSDAAKDLTTLRAIEVTDYTYIDTIAKGAGKQKKVIAQQVEKVFPQAVRKDTDVVPDIYAMAEYKDGWMKLSTTLKKGERVRLISGKDDSVHEVLEVKDGAFRTAFKPSAAQSGKTFVYGREVKDFHYVDYEAIAMLNVSATQELAKQSELLKAENAELKQRLAKLEAKDKSRDARLARIEKALGDEKPQAIPTAFEVK